MTALVLFAFVIAGALYVGIKAMKADHALQADRIPHLRAGREAA